MTPGTRTSTHLCPGPSELKEEIVARALALGFDSCRVTTAAAPPHTNEVRGWLRDGAAGEMDWMARGEEKRCDPQEILSGARSIIVVALNYWQGKEESPASGG